MELLKHLKRFEGGSFKPVRPLFQYSLVRAAMEAKAKVEAEAEAKKVPAKEEAAAVAEEKKTTETAKETAKTGADLVKMKAEMDLNKLQTDINAKVKEGFVSFLNDIKLEEKNPISLVNAGVDFKSEGFKNSIADKIKPLLLKKDLVTAIKILNDTFELNQFDKASVADFVSAIYANGIAAKADTNFSHEFPRKDEYAKALPDEVSKFNFTAKLKLNDPLNPEITIDEDEKFKTGYKNFIETHKTVAVEAKPADATTGKAFREQCKFGAGFLVSMGLVHEYHEHDIVGENEINKQEAEELTNQAYAEALNGGNIFASAIIWLFGGGAFLADGGAGLTEMVGQLGAKPKALAEQMKAKLEKIPLFNKKSGDKAAVAVADDAKKALDTAKLFDGKQFTDILKQSDKQLSKEGVKLSGAADLAKLDSTKASGVLKIDLESGGKVIIPGGADVSKLKIGDAPVLASATPTEYSAGFLKIEGTLPAGFTILPNKDGRIYMNLG